MTVYELIQELSQYNADTEVKFHCEAEFDRKDENDTQEVTVTAEFDDYVDFDDIDDYELGSKRGWNGRPHIVINLSY